MAAEGGARKSPKEFETLLRAANKAYRQRHGVVGVGIGPKFRKGKSNPSEIVLHFYVRQKRPLSKLRKLKLPKYVFLRDNKGRVLRHRRINTDVIEVGNVEAACAAGDVIRSLNDAGAISLLFRNKSPATLGRSFLLTCSHVVGDLRSSPPNPDSLTADCDPERNPYARTIFCSVPDQGIIEFDVAVASLASPMPVGGNCSISTKPPSTLTKSVARSEISFPFPVSCVLPATLSLNANIQSFLGTVRVQYRIGEVEVRNAFLIDAQVAPGDSGGVLYVDDAVVGLVFARSTRGFGWCHLISEALTFAGSQIGEILQPF